MAGNNNTVNWVSSELFFKSDSSTLWVCVISFFFLFSILQLLFCEPETIMILLTPSSGRFLFLSLSNLDYCCILYLHGPRCQRLTQKGFLGRNTSMCRDSSKYAWIKKAQCPVHFSVRSTDLEEHTLKLHTFRKQLKFIYLWSIVQ